MGHGGYGVPWPLVHPGVESPKKRGSSRVNRVGGGGGGEREGAFQEGGLRDVGAWHVEICVQPEVGTLGVYIH
jgi:hypothetical protein